MKHPGVIASLTATGNQPSYQGYDIRPKNPNQRHDFQLNDFELIFHNLSQEVGASKVLSSESVFKNIDKTIFRVFEEKLEQTKEIEKVEESSEITFEVEGDIIKQIVRTDGKYKAILEHTDMDEATIVVQNLFACWANGKAKKLMLERELQEKARKGILDILNDNGTERLVIYDPKELQPTRDTVEKQIVKKTIYFITNMYKNNKEYQDTVNCSHEENGYICKFVKGQIAFEKVSGEVSDLEIAVVKDLKQFDKKKEQLDG
jgi:hypothetical protein